MAKTALVTGITGQDGSYLAEYLLEKGYDVHGVVRHASTSRFERIHHLRDRVTLYEADLLDQLSLVEAIERSRPDELYNLAAQSFVPTSWKQPLLTGEFTALGVTRVLEALRHVDPSIRFYQASSSEMFGNVQGTPQDEDTPFYPRSPYGVAKVYGHFITVNYRESYDLHAVSGILFNHECVTADTPVITHRGGMIDIRPVEDVVPHRTDPSSGIKYSQPPAEPLEVWDEDGWTSVTQMTATWNDPTKGGKPVHRVAARGASFAATDDHVAFRSGREDVEVGELEEGDRLELVDLPEPTGSVVMTDEEAWLLGILAADGDVSGRQARFVSSDEDLVERVAEIWRRVTGGGTSRRVGPSGSENTTPAIQLDLVGAPSYGRWVQGQLYTRRSGFERVPGRVLNADEEARRAFLKGYSDGDGSKAGRGTYEFESFETNSSTLAQGLWWLAGVTLGRRTILCVEERDGRLCYQIDLNSPSNPSDAETGEGVHLRRPKAEIVSMRSESEPGWLFDLATDSGTFHAGVGDGWIHNSPRRGLEFVTRKVARAAAAIDLGLQDELRIGNLDARRDWGFAGDYVDAMWRMLQRDEPDDYVVGTGETRTVRRLCEVAFEAVGTELAWEGEGVDERGLDADTGEPLVVVDEEYFRPAEVEALVADPSKAERELDWEPRVSFREMIRRMVAADRERLEEAG